MLLFCFRIRLFLGGGVVVVVVVCFIFYLGHVQMLTPSNASVSVSVCLSLCL